MLDTIGKLRARASICARHCAARSASDSISAQTRSNALDRRQQVEPNVVPQMPAIRVAGIGHKSDASVRRSICLGLAARHVQKRSDDRPFGEKTRETARSCAAESAHDDGLELIVPRVRGRDRPTGVLAATLERKAQRSLRHSDSDSPTLVAPPATTSSRRSRAARTTSAERLSSCGSGADGRTSRRRVAGDRSPTRRHREEPSSRCHHSRRAENRVASALAERRDALADALHGAVGTRRHRVNLPDAVQPREPTPNHPLACCRDISESKPTDHSVHCGSPSA